MANKVKKISINALEQAVKDNFDKTTDVEWNGLNIIVKRNISLDEMMVFVNNVVGVCFREGDNGYAPELKDFIIRAITIELYTNLSTPSNIQKKYDLLYGSDIFNVVIEHIDKDQYGCILSAIKEKIASINHANIAHIQKQIQEVEGAVSNLNEQLTKAFDGIDAEGLKSFIEAVAENGIDEEKIVRAYFDNKQKEMS